MELLKTMDRRLSAYDPWAAKVQIVRFAVLQAQRTGKAEDIAEARAAFAELEPEIESAERWKRLRKESPELAQVEAELKEAAFAKELQRRGSMTGAQARQWERAYERGVWARAWGGGRVMDLTQRPSYVSPVSVVRARKVNLQAQGQAQRGDAEADADADGMGRNGRHKDKRTGDSAGAGNNPPVHYLRFFCACVSLPLWGVGG